MIKVSNVSFNRYAIQKRNTEPAFKGNLPRAQYPDILIRLLNKGNVPCVYCGERTLGLSDYSCYVKALLDSRAGKLHETIERMEWAIRGSIGNKVKNELLSLAASTSRGHETFPELLFSLSLKHAPVFDKQNLSVFGNAVKYAQNHITNPKLRQKVITYLSSAAREAGVRGEGRFDKFEFRAALSKFCDYIGLGDNDTNKLFSIFADLPTLDDSVSAFFARYSHKMLRPKNPDLRRFQSPFWTPKNFVGELLGCSKLTIDHAVPLRKQGVDDISNMLPCCGADNRAKSTHTLQEYAEKLGIDLETNIKKTRQELYKMGEYDEYADVLGKMQAEISKQMSA